MMKVLFKTGIVLAAFVFLTNALQAQKIGYVNSALVISELPEMKQLQSKLEALQTQLKKKGEAEVAKYKKEEEAAMLKKQRGEMTPKEEEEVMKKLQQMQEKIYAMGADMEKQLAEKQNEGMEPILQKVNDAIKAVASEGGYSYVLDTQSGVILYADESADLTDEVKAKLEFKE
ncbi:MAG TPA: OmpH family outer membrane protein [Bacteroidetes bacterium]|nr:OmpH family outer membrane protein [Bacteroidota bacterium]